MLASQACFDSHGRDTAKEDFEVSKGCCRNWQVIVGERAGAALEDLDIFHSCAVLHWRMKGRQQLSRFFFDSVASSAYGLSWAPYRQPLLLPLFKALTQHVMISKCLMVMLSCCFSLNALLSPDALMRCEYLLKMQ